MRALAIIVLITAVIWCVGNVVLVAIGAPAIFQHAPPHATHIERDVAGAIFGDLLRRWLMVVEMSLLPVLATVTVITAGALIGIRRYKLASFCFVMIVSIGVLHLWSRTVLNEALATAPPLDRSQPYTLEQRQVFNAIHARSTRVYGAETVLLLLFIAGVGIALSLRDEQPPASARPSTH
jgi:hypothetical protein